MPVDKAASAAEIKTSAASVENLEEEEGQEDEEEGYVPVPVYRRVVKSLDAETKRREKKKNTEKMSS